MKEIYLIHETLFQTSPVLTIKKKNLNANKSIQVIKACRMAYQDEEYILTCINIIQVPVDMPTEPIVR